MSRGSNWPCAAPITPPTRAPIDPARLAAVPADRLGALRLQLAPAVTLISSPYPILSIWRANTGDGGAHASSAARGSADLAPRPRPRRMTPVPAPLPCIDALLRRRHSGKRGTARAGDEFELSALLALLGRPGRSPPSMRRTDPAPARHRKGPPMLPSLHRLAAVSRPHRRRSVTDPGPARLCRGATGVFLGIGR